MNKVHNIQNNPAYIFRTGTLHSNRVTFYMLNGAYIGRSKSSLTGKQVKQSARFRKTMHLAAKLGRASSVAAAVYGRLPEGWKLHSLYRKLVGVGNRLLKNEHYSDDALTDALWQYLYSLGFRSDIEYELIQQSTVMYQDRVVQKTVSRKRCNKVQRATIRDKHQRSLFIPYKHSSITINNLHVLRRARAPDDRSAYNAAILNAMTNVVGNIPPLRGG